MPMLATFGAGSARSFGFGSGESWDGLIYLWRIYINTISSYGLFDIQNGYFKNSGGADMVSGYGFDSSGTLQQGNYCVFNSGTSNPFTDSVRETPWDAGPSTHWGGYRTAWSDQVGDYIAIWFNTPTGDIQMSGADISLRTFLGARPDRSPRNMSFQYYNGPLKNYDASLWTTYATLTNTAQTKGTPRFLNITQGSTIVAS